MHVMDQVDIALKTAESDLAEELLQPGDDRAVLAAEVQALRQRLTPAPCTCGSGGHPRDCARHPDRKELHALEISNETLRDEIQELEGQLAKLCDAAQAVLDGKARDADSAGDRYVIDSTLRKLEATLVQARSVLLGVA